MNSPANYSSQTRRHCECCKRYTVHGYKQVLKQPKYGFLKYLCLCRFSYLQKHTAEHFVDHREEGWQPLIYYRASLLAVAEGEDAVSYVSSDRKPYLPNRSPFSKKLEGTSLNKNVKHRFVLLLPPAASICASFLFFKEVNLLVRSARLSPKLVKFKDPVLVQGELRSYSSHSDYYSF